MGKARACGTNRGRGRNFPAELQYHPVCSRGARVSNIIQEEHWAIPNYVKGLIPQICSEIEGNEIGYGEDEWVWTARADGDYFEGNLRSITTKKTECSLGENSLV